MTDDNQSTTSEVKAMEKSSSPLPIVSLVFAGIALVGIPIGMSRTWPQGGEFRFLCFVALIVAVTSVGLGVAGFVKARGDEFGRRVPAVIAIGLGGVLSLIYALIFWLSTPF